MGCDVASFPFFHVQSQEVSEVLYKKPMFLLEKGLEIAPIGS